MASTSQTTQPRPEQPDTTANKSAKPSSSNTQPQPPRPSQVKEGGGTYTLLLFASAASHCDDTELLALPAPSTLPELFEYLEGRWPGFRRKVLRGSAVVRNLEYVEVEFDGEGCEMGEDGEKVKDRKEWRIEKGDEVGIVPPVSSG